MKLVDCVDVCKRGNASLNFGATLTRRLVDALDHLLLSIDPVEVIPEHRQTHWLQYVGVFDNNPIGACKGKKVKGNGNW